jgi:hypothetical protein
MVRNGGGGGQRRHTSAPAVRPNLVRLSPPATAVRPLTPPADSTNPFVFYTPVFPVSRMHPSPPVSPIGAPPTPTPTETSLQDAFGTGLARPGVRRASVDMGRGSDAFSSPLHAVPSARGGTAPLGIFGRSEARRRVRRASIDMGRGSNDFSDYLTAPSVSISVSPRCSDACYVPYAAIGEELPAATQDMAAWSSALRRWAFPLLLVLYCSHLASWVDSSGPRITQKQSLSFMG